MKDNNKEKKDPLFYRVPAKLFTTFESDISRYRLDEKVKHFYLFIGILLSVTIAAIGLLFAFDLTIIIGTIILITIMIFSAITTW